MGTGGQPEDKQCAGILTVKLPELVVLGKLGWDSPIHIPTDAGETQPSLNLSQLQSVLLQCAQKKKGFQLKPRQEPRLTAI